MSTYSLWLLSTDGKAEPAPVDLSAQTASEAVKESRMLWMEGFAKGLRIYDNTSGGLVYEMPRVTVC
jgi:hypothetical protein